MKQSNRLKKNSLLTIFISTLTVASITAAITNQVAAAEGLAIHIGKQGEPGLEPPIWVSMSGFTGEADQVLRFDLYVQGFNFTNAENAQYLITGSSNGDLQGKVTDRFSKNAVVPLKAYTGAPIRRQAHFFADDFVNAINNADHPYKGIAKTKIAFAVEGGGNAEIYVSDFDGYGAKAATQDGTLVASPSWVPGKFALFYSSYK